MAKFFDTDGEAGDENLASPLDKAQAIRALEVMHTRGLIDEETYQKRLKELSE